MPVGSRSRSRAPVQRAPVIPFTAASHEHTEPAFDVTQAIGSTAVQLGPYDVPAFGYLRHIYLEVSCTLGSGGTLVSDYPFNLIQSVSLNDVNGAPIFGPLDGYALAQINIFGGYGGSYCDPRLTPWYVSTVNAAFALRIPVEISHHNAMGSLANQNAAAAYKVNITLNPASALITGGTFNTNPTVRIRGFLEAWTLPNDTDVAGRPQAQVPYAHGTTQYWSQFIKSVNAGANTTLLPRVGNLIRNILVIARNSTGVAGSNRDDNVFPDPPVLAWDARSLLNDTQKYRVERMRSQGPIVSGGRDTGVFLYGFSADDGAYGDDDPTLWLPTVQSTRLEIDGSSVSGGTLQVITNDIAPVEVIPTERFVETSESGFHPQVSGSGPAVQ